jgi:hypothetical protein
LWLHAIHLIENEELGVLELGLEHLVDVPILLFRLQDLRYAHDDDAAARTESGEICVSCGAQGTR